LVCISRLLKRKKWLVEPPGTLSWVYFPAMLRDALGVERTRVWIVALIIAAWLAFCVVLAFDSLV